MEIPKAERRRNDLRDAAIAVLAAEGARGLTHRGVDRQAGFAEGTTSFYFQTRASLLRATLERVIELDIADFTGALDAAGEGESLLSTLAVQAMRTAVEPERSRARARFELMMIAARDPDLGQAMDGLMDRFAALSQAAVEQAQPAGSSDPELIEAQAFAVVNFLGGFLFRLALGLSEIDSAQSLERYLHAVIAGVAEDFAKRPL